MNTKSQSNEIITERLGSYNGIPPNGPLKTGLAGVLEEVHGKELILLHGVPPGLCCRNSDPCCVQQQAAVVEQLCSAAGSFVSPLLSPPCAPPAGFSGGAEAESTGEAKAEKRVASKSESCRGETGAVRGDARVAAR